MFRLLKSWPSKIRCLGPWNYDFRKSCVKAAEIINFENPVFRLLKLWPCLRKPDVYTAEIMSFENPTFQLLKSRPPKIATSFQPLLKVVTSFKDRGILLLDLLRKGFLLPLPFFSQIPSLGRPLSRHSSQHRPFLLFSLYFGPEDDPLKTPKARERSANICSNNRSVGPVPRSPCREGGAENAW